MKGVKVMQKLKFLVGYSPCLGYVKCEKEDLYFMEIEGHHYIIKKSFDGIVTVSSDFTEKIEDFETEKKEMILEVEENVKEVHINLDFELEDVALHQYPEEDDFNYELWTSFGTFYFDNYSVYDDGFFLITRGVIIFDGTFDSFCFDMKKLLDGIKIDELVDGYPSKYLFENQENIVDGVAVDPLLAYEFSDTEHDNRHDLELLNWWGRSYITTEKFGEDNHEEYCKRMTEFNADYKVESLEEFTARRESEEKSWNEHWVGGIRYDVRCLTGGAWDRPSILGQYSTLEEALIKANETTQLYFTLDNDTALVHGELLKNVVILSKESSTKEKVS